MARRTTTTRARPGEIVVVNQPAPVARTRRRSSGGGTKKKKSRRRSSSSSSGGSTKGRMVAGAIGGFGVGIVEKAFGDKLPTLPIVGRKGAIALGVFFLNPSSPILKDIGIAAATLAGYEFGSTGKVSGDVMGEVGGIAAQM